MNTFGAKLRVLRKQKDLSQSEIAKLLGYSRVQVSNWEIERSEPDIQALGKLAEFYGVTVDYITGKVDTPTASLLPQKMQPREGAIEDIKDDRPAATTLPAANKKPKDLDEFLRQSDIMFKGTPLSEEAKERLRNILTEIDGMAKEMNRKKI